MQPEQFSNLFDFIDYLESLNPVSGTANENRAFVFNTINAGFNVVDNPADLLSAYASVGISIPESAFTAIFNLRLESEAPGNIIQILAPNSVIPGLELGTINGDFATDYVSYFHITFYDPDIDEYITKKRYLLFDDTLTPSQLTNEISNDFETKYKVRVTNVALDRIYRTFGN